MRIGGSDGKSPDGAQAPGRKVASTQETNGGAPRAQGADGNSAAVVSSGASDLAARTEKSEQAHAERVEGIRLKITRGEYKIDYEELARRIVDEEMARASGK